MDNLLEYQYARRGFYFSVLTNNGLSTHSSNFNLNGNTGWVSVLVISSKGGMGTTLVACESLATLSRFENP